jgi:L,D-transpeptidase catalytic domain
MATRRLRYFTRGQRVRVSGSVRPFVPGQSVTLHVIRRGKTSKRYRAPVRRGRGGGRYSLRFTVRRRGRLRLVAKHAATPQQRAFRSGDKRIEVVLWRAAAGNRGVRVLLMQRRLQRLGYSTSLSGAFDSHTSYAVLAFRKVNGMGESSYASPAVFNRLFRNRGAFRLRHRNPARHVEFDWSRQVLVIVRNGRPWRTHHASSGKPSTPTVFGTFRFYRKEPGTNSHGMLHSNYFIGGYAIHGYPSVPLYPASHGCIRVPIPQASGIDRAIAIGDVIYVYR